MVWREQKISHVCLGVVSFPEVEHPRKNHTVGILLSSTIFSTESIARNSRCFEGLLLVFDSDYSGVCILVAHDHLPGMLPACKQLYFLEHLQNHNWWYCARSTPTVMLSCWLCIDCLLNTWNQMMDQFNKLLSNVSCSFSFESSWNRIPERGSPTCCCSRTLNYFKACLLQIAFAWAGFNLPLCAQFLRYKAYEFLFEEIRVLLKFNSKFSACHLLMAIPSYGASRLRNFRYCSWCWPLFL